MSKPTYEQLEKKVAHYEDIFGVSEYDPAIKGYRVLVSILKQQNEFLSNFKITGYIASDEKAEITAYKNAKDLWENLPKMIESVNNLRIGLKIEEENNKAVRKPFSAKDVANSTV
jgi:hypothetical protein